ncbi:MAG: polysulfide reductase [Halobacteria archaeon]|nr:polysulfide reductase [Halobacteria archaeon]
MQLRNFFTPTWAVIAAGLLFGAYFAIGELSVGGMLATNNGMIWTLPLVTYIFLALMSTGVSIVLCHGTLTQRDEIMRQQRSLLVLAASLLIGGFVALGTELGSPLHLFWLVFSPNLTSPIWYMGTLYSIELVLLLVKLVRDLQGHHGRIDQSLTWATLGVAVAAALMLGAVFGTVTGRADFHGLHASILTLTAALASGAAVIVLTQPSGGLPQIYIRALRGFSALMAILLTLRWGYEVHSSVVDLQGWVTVWMIAPLAVVALFGGRLPRTAAALVAAVSLWVVLAFVITGQMVTLGPMATWYGAVQAYRPNLAEVGILVLGIAVAAALFQLGRQAWLSSSPQAGR